MFNYLCKKKDIETFSLSPENYYGEKGNGGMSTDGAAAYAARDLGIGWKVSPYSVLNRKSILTIADVKGEGAIKHIWLTHGRECKARELIFRIFFDDDCTPAVECPLGDFFANASGQYKQISSLPICFNPGYAMNCYFEMPYKKSFKITIENLSENNCNVYYQIDCEKKNVGDDFLYFHAFFNRTNPLPYKENYIILDGIEGCGQYVGTYMNWGVNNNGWWGEGEIKFYIDGDKDFPTICGTGTEDYFCGAYNFDVNGRYKDFSTPYSGFSVAEETDETYRSQRRFNLYRFHITDPIYFKQNLRVAIQALGWRSEGRYLPLQDDISSVAYWYSNKTSHQIKPLPNKDYLEII